MNKNPRLGSFKRQVTQTYIQSHVELSTTSALALMALTLGFDIVELWAQQDENKDLRCICVHATDEILYEFTEVQTGFYPPVGSDDSLGKSLCDKTEKSVDGYYWQTSETEKSADSKTEKGSLYVELKIPILTKMCYKVKGSDIKGNVYILGYSKSEIKCSPSKLKFLCGLGYATYVAAYDLDEEDDEEAPSPSKDGLNAELDSKLHVPVRKLQPSAKSIQLFGSFSSSEEASSSFFPRLSKEESIPEVPTRAPSQLDDSMEAPTWKSLAPFSFPVEQVPVKYKVQNDLTFDSFKDLNHIANGSNSHIFLGYLGKDKVIVKVISKEAEVNPVAMQEFDIEHGLLARLSHPNVLKVLGAGLKPRRFIVLEWLEGGTLQTMLEENESKPGFRNKLFFSPTFMYDSLLVRLREIASVFHYLHQEYHPGATVIHRDLKPDNVGFTSDGTLKLFDFGLASLVKRRSSPDDCYEMTGYTGSLRYMAPEVALRKPYSEKADVYSFGIVAWQMARDRIPFAGFGKKMFMEQVVKGGMRPKIDKSWPPAFKSLLTSCWDADEKKRPTFQVILQKLNGLIEGTVEGSQKSLSGKFTPVGKLVSFLFSGSSDNNEK